MAGRILLLSSLLLAATEIAYAQSVSFTPRIEFVGNVWSPPPHVTVSSQTTTCESSGSRIVVPVSCDGFSTRTVVGGDPADLVNALALHQDVVGYYRATMHIAGPHRIRLAYAPTVSRGVATPTQSFLLAEHGSTGAGVGVVVAKATWTTFRIGYEWDFLRRSVGYLGITGDLHHSAIYANGQPRDRPNAGGFGYTFTRTIPTVGTAGEVRIAKHLSFGGDVALLRLDRRREGTFRNADVFATIDIVRGIGARVGYRSAAFTYAITDELDEGSRIHTETGDVRARGPYVGAVVKF